MATIDQRLQQKQIQKLSPQQIQLIKLLELQTMQLEERIKEELMENPVLEEGAPEPKNKDDDDNDNQQDNSKDDDQNTKDISIDEYLLNNDAPAYQLSSRNYSKDEQKTEIPFSVGSSFYERMLEQLGHLSLTPQDNTIAEYIIGNIDDDGYLRRPLDAISDDLAFRYSIDVPVEKIETILSKIQEFDPPGVAARDLRECLLIQLNQKKETLHIQIAKKILTQYFAEFTRKHYDKIANRCGVTKVVLKSAVAEILRLNPKPGGMFQYDRLEVHIVPDFILENKDGTLIVALNSRNIPELRISRVYTEMLATYNKNRKDKNTREAATFVKQKLDSAKWFIDAIKQRQNTLMLTMETIVNIQRNYFLGGGDETLLVPMILKDVADKTNLDISTISRVASSKYVQTPFGIYPLKFFFSEAMYKDTGDEVSSHEIRRILKDNIDAESKEHPLTDEELSDILQAQGYLIARRTVAKYREYLNIPVARLRKEL